MNTEVTVDRSEPDQPVLRFTRHLPHPASRVWDAITDSQQLSQWYPCRVELEPLKGGRITFAFDGEEPEISEITEFDPPHALSYTWGGEQLRWTVEPRGEGSILRLNNTILDPERIPDTAAGWDTCIEDLVAVLEGRPVNGHSGPDHDKIEGYRNQLAQ